MPRQKNTSVIKKVLRRELVSNRKYKTTYKDIKKYFKIINKAVFSNLLSPFNDVLIKKIYSDETKKKVLWSSDSLGVEEKRYQSLSFRNVTILQKQKRLCGHFRTRNGTPISNGQCR